MTVQELIDLLDTFPKTARVVIECSIEGANFSPLGEIYAALYHEHHQQVMPFQNGVMTPTDLMRECVNAVVFRSEDFNRY